MLLSVPLSVRDFVANHRSADERLVIPKPDRGLMTATVLAIGLHAVLIFGVSFSMGKTPSELAMDVAISLSENQQKNDDARFIANASQEGGGQVRQQLRLETNDLSPLTSDSIEDTQDIINLKKQTRQQAYQQSYLRTTLSIRHTQSDSDNKSDKQDDDVLAQEERLRKKIQTLEAQLSQKQQVFASKTKVQTVDSNATTHGKSAAYLENFRNHVERVANQYYPHQAKQQAITGDVRLMVVIASDGQVKAIKLLESSGSAILDEAAKQSVRQSAPYGRFDPQMGDLTELRVVRTWRYSDQLEVTY